MPKKSKKPLNSKGVSFHTLKKKLTINFHRLFSPKPITDFLPPLNPPNYNFKSRLACSMETIDKKLEQKDPCYNNFLLIYGPSGAGKSTLANRYAREALTERKYAHVAYFEVVNLEHLYQQISDIIKHCFGESYDNHCKNIEVFYERLKKVGKLLIIIDCNQVDENLIKSLPREGSINFIILAQYDVDHLDYIQKISLDRLSQEEGLAWLVDTRTDQSIDIASQILQELDYSPELIIQAKHYIDSMKKSGYGLKCFLKDYRQQHEQISGKIGKIANLQIKNWEIQLKRLNEIELTCLGYCCYFGVNSIPKQWLNELFENSHKGHNFSEILNSLLNRYFIHLDEKFEFIIINDNLRVKLQLEFIKISHRFIIINDITNYFIKKLPSAPTALTLLNQLINSKVLVSIVSNFLDLYSSVVADLKKEIKNSSEIIDNFFNNITKLYIFIILYHHIYFNIDKQKEYLESFTTFLEEAKIINLGENKLFIHVWSLFVNSQTDNDLDTETILKKLLLKVRHRSYEALVKYVYAAYLSRRLLHECIAGTFNSELAKRLKGYLDPDQLKELCIPGEMRDEISLIIKICSSYQTPIDCDIDNEFKSLLQKHTPNSLSYALVQIVWGVIQTQQKGELTTQFKEGLSMLTTHHQEWYQNLIIQYPNLKDLVGQNANAAKPLLIGEPIIVNSVAIHQEYPNNTLMLKSSIDTSEYSSSADMQEKKSFIDGQSDKHRKQVTQREIQKVKSNYHPNNLIQGLGIQETIISAGIRRSYFESALRQLKNMIKSSSKSLVYLLGYEKEPKRIKKLFKRLWRDLMLICGEEHILCPTFDLKPGDKKSRRIEQMEQCQFIVVLCTEALKKVYNDFKTNVLSNIELTNVFTLLSKNTHKIIPLYIGSDDYILFSLQDFKEIPIIDASSEKEYQSSLFALLQVLVRDSILKETIKKQEKSIKVRYKASQTLNLKKQQALLNDLRQTLGQGLEDKAPSLSSLSARIGIWSKGNGNLLTQFIQSIKKDYDNAREFLKNANLEEKKAILAQLTKEDRLYIINTVGQLSKEMEPTNSFRKVS